MIIKGTANMENGLYPKNKKSLPYRKAFHWLDRTTIRFTQPLVSNETQHNPTKIRKEFNMTPTPTFYFKLQYQNWYYLFFEYGLTINRAALS